MKHRAEPSGGPPPPVIEGVTDLERIGSGGFSVVYRGRERVMSRDVAVKVLNSGITTESERRTFERECRALGQLSAHPNIVTVYRPAFTTDMRPCIVMELYHGNYRDRLDRTGPLPFDELLAVGVRIAGALHTAHQAGVLHRDLKPHNIFLSAYGEPALGDFGISTIDDERSHSVSDASGLSVAYAAPEVLEDSEASVASDVYSLGATLYHLAAGTAPFASGDLRTTVRRILTDPPPPLPRTDVPPGLDRALRSALAKEPGDRLPSAQAFAELLREVQSRAGLTPTTVPTAAAGLAVPLGTPGTVAPTATPAGAGAPAPSSPADVVAGSWPAPVSMASGVVPVAAEAEGAGRAPVAPPPTNDDVSGGDDPSTVTVARRRRPEPEHEPEAEPGGPSTRRRWIAAGAAVAAVAAVAGAVAIVGGDGDEGPATPTTVVGSGPDDTFYDTLAVPVSIAVSATGAGRFEVDIPPVDGATGYEVTAVNADVEPVIAAADELPATILAPDADQLCVVVRAVGAGGRISRDSEPACAG